MSAREPGSDDDRKPTQCLTCGLVGSGEVCPQCMELLSDLDEPDTDFGLPIADCGLESKIPNPKSKIESADAASTLALASSRRASAASTSGLPVRRPDQPVRDVRADGASATTIGSTPGRHSKVPPALKCGGFPALTFPRGEVSATLRVPGSSSGVLTCRLCRLATAGASKCLRYGEPAFPLRATTRPSTRDSRCSLARVSCGFVASTS